MDKKAYEQMKKVYTESLGKLYNRDLKNLFDTAKEKIPIAGLATTPTTLIGLDRDQWTLEANSQDRKKYDSVLEQVLTQLEPVFIQEQQFCVNFFQVNCVI